MPKIKSPSYIALFCVAALALISCTNNETQPQPATAIAQTVEYAPDTFAVLIAEENERLALIESEAQRVAAEENAIAAAALAEAQRIEGLRQGVVAFAREQLGEPYQLWGNSDSTWDCSGLVQAAYQRVAGIDSRHSAFAQGQQGRRISQEELRAGDLVIWNKAGNDGYHVSIWTGVGTEISAYNEARGVVEDTAGIYPQGTSVFYVSFF